MDKKDIPYYQVAREALIKWNGLTEEQADKFIEESSFEEIDAQVDAQASMQYAINAIGESLGLSDEEIARFADEVFGRTDSTEMSGKLYKKLREKNSNMYFSSKENYMPQLVVNTMEAVHDGWVKDKAKLFFTKKADRGQQFQYLPLELIGWDEAKSDLLFIKPIIHAIGGYVDEAEIKKECNRRTIRYFKELSYSRDEGTMGMRVHNLDDLGKEIVENGLLDNYEPLDTVIEVSDITLWDAMKDREFVTGRLLPQLTEKWFIKDEELMDTLAYGSKSIFEPDGPSRDEVIEELLKDEKFVRSQDPHLVEEELEYLRAKKQQLMEQAKTISEAEKLIEEKENKGQNLDEQGE